MGPTCTLSYWKIRGLSECCRLVAEYCRLPYQMNNYDGATDDRAKWLEFKASGKEPFPNLPSLEFKGTYISE